MTYILSGGALNSTHSCSQWCMMWKWRESCTAISHFIEKPLFFSLLHCLLYLQLNNSGSIILERTILIILRNQFRIRWQQPIRLLMLRTRLLVQSFTRLKPPTRRMTRRPGYQGVSPCAGDATVCAKQFVTTPAYRLRRRLPLLVAAFSKSFRCFDSVEDRTTKQRRTRTHVACEHQVCCENCFFTQLRTCLHPAPGAYAPGHKGFLQGGPKKEATIKNHH